MQRLKELLDNQGKIVSDWIYWFESGKELGLEIKISVSASV